MTTTETEDPKPKTITVEYTEAQFNLVAQLLKAEDTRQAEQGKSVAAVRAALENVSGALLEAHRKANPEPEPKKKATRKKTASKDQK